MRVSSPRGGVQIVVHEFFVAGTGFAIIRFVPVGLVAARVSLFVRVRSWATMYKWATVLRYVSIGEPRLRASSPSPHVVRLTREAGSCVVAVMAAHVGVHVEFAPTVRPWTTEGGCTCVCVDMDSKTTRTVEALETRWAYVLLPVRRFVRDFSFAIVTVLCHVVRATRHGLRRHHREGDD